MCGVAAPASCYLCYWAGFPETLDVFTMVLVPVCVYRVVAVVPSASVCCTRVALISAYWPGSSAVCVCVFACLCCTSAGMLRHSSIICVHYLCSLVVLCAMGSGQVEQVNLWLCRAQFLTAVVLGMLC